MIEKIDTGQASIIHLIFPSLPTENISFWKHYFVPYISTMLITYGGLLITALLSPPSIYIPSQNVKIPFLLDMNLIWMFSISLQIIFIFLITERIMIPAGLGKLKEASVLSIDNNNANKLKKSWERKYKTSNIVGQIIGFIVGISVSIANYTTFTQVGFKSWQAINGNVHLVGWYSLFCVFVFYFALMVLVTRNFTTSFFLKEVVENSTLQIVPFHPDKCGGLHPVGNFGLRNQYLLSLVGVNIILLFRNTVFLGTNVQLLILAISAALFYVTIGPIGFISPLLPFRNAMQRDKSRLMNLVANRVKMDFNRIIQLIKDGKMTKEDDELLTRYKNIGELIERLPVWPFDVETLTKFFSAYLLPLLILVVNLFLPKIISYFFP